MTKSKQWTGRISFWAEKNLPESWDFLQMFATPSWIAEKKFTLITGGKRENSKWKILAKISKLQQKFLHLSSVFFIPSNDKINFVDYFVGS